MILPNFLIIGAQKAGTTAIYYYLRQHPQIFMSIIKEPDFFALEDVPLRFEGPGDNERVNLRKTTTLKAYSKLFKKVRCESAIGEASTAYLWSTQAAFRIKHHIPEAKLIAILRDPVERAYSEYMYWRRDGREPVPNFIDAFREDDIGSRKKWWIGHYKRNGMYFSQLSRYFKLFSKKQIRIYLYDHFKVAPFEIIRDIFRFLELGESFVPKMKDTYNVSGVPKSQALHALHGFLAKPNLFKSLFLKPFLPAPIRFMLREGALNTIRNKNLQKLPIDCESRAVLIDHFKDEIIQLQDLIGQDLSAWLRVETVDTAQ